MPAETVGAAATAALIKVGVTAIERAVPTGLAWIRSWWAGKRVLVVGQSRAGKTTFIDYLQHGIFEHEQEREKTLEEHRSPQFSVNLGKDKTLQVIIGSVTDLPGQVGAIAHADLAFEHKPHAIVVFLDLTTPLSGEKASITWLQEFCNRLETKWRASGKRNKKLKSIVVALNKHDRAEESKVGKCKLKCRKILNRELRGSKGKMTEKVAVMPSVLVTNPEGPKLIDSIITQLVKALAK